MGQMLHLMMWILETVALVNLLVRCNLFVRLMTLILSHQLDIVLIFLEVHVQGGAFGVVDLTFHIECLALGIRF